MPASSALRRIRHIEETMRPKLLCERRVRGLQLRYRFEEREWCDTLLALDSGVRLIRIERQ